MMSIFSVTERKVVEAVGAWRRAVCSHPTVMCWKGCCLKRATRNATYFSGGNPVATAPSCDEHGGEPYTPIQVEQCDDENHLEDCAVELARQDLIAAYNARALVDKTLP